MENNEPKLREIRCKNDECRALLGRENVVLGIFVFDCPNCGTKSEFKMQYRALGSDFIKKLKEKYESEMKGGEK